MPKPSRSSSASPPFFFCSSWTSSPSSPSLRLCWCRPVGLERGASRLCAGAAARLVRPQWSRRSICDRSRASGSASSATAASFFFLSFFFLRGEGPARGRRGRVEALARTASDPRTTTADTTGRRDAPLALVAAHAVRQRVLDVDVGPAYFHDFFFFFLSFLMIGPFSTT